MAVSNRNVTLTVTHTDSDSQSQSHTVLSNAAVSASVAKLPIPNFYLQRELGVALATLATPGYVPA